MDAANIANLIEVIATLIALAGLAVSFWFSWRGQILQRQQAEAASAAAAESNREAQAAAQRAAASAALTIDELTRIADGVQTMASHAGAAAAAAAAAAVAAASAAASAPASQPGSAPGSTSARPGEGPHEFEAAAAPTLPPFESPGPPPAASWSLSHDQGDFYRLSNTGTALAHDVWVGGSSSLEGPRGAEDGAWIAAGSSITFTARILPTTTDSSITVTWAPTPGGDERRSWRYPLPTPATPEAPAVRPPTPAESS